MTPDTIIEKFLIKVGASLVGGLRWLNNVQYDGLVMNTDTSYHPTFVRITIYFPDGSQRKVTIPRSKNV